MRFSFLQNLVYCVISKQKIHLKDAKLFKHLTFGYRSMKRMCTFEYCLFYEYLTSCLVFTKGKTLFTVKK